MLSSELTYDQVNYILEEEYEVSPYIKLGHNATFKESK